jgi:transglutaminase-like putative cysteine protease
LEEYLKSTFFINSNHPLVVEKSREVTEGARDEMEKGKRLFYFVRDSIKYEPVSLLNRETYKASEVLRLGKGLCVHKAVLLAALARAVKIPSRLGFADIRNHQIPPAFIEFMGKNFFAYHGYSELYLKSKWVKATPTFDSAMCSKQSLIPVEFDGEHDAMLSKYDQKGRLHIEYLRFRGSFSDLPFEEMMKTYVEVYGSKVLELFEKIVREGGRFPFLSYE